MLAASVAMVGVLLGLKRAPADFGLGDRLGAVVSMAVFVGSGAVVYFGILLVGGRDILLGLVNDFRGRRGRRG